MTASAEQDQPIVRPAALRAGDRVAVLAPSSPVFPDRVDPGLRVLASWGYDVVEGRHLRTGSTHLAGDDDERLADLRAALDDPEVRAVLAGRGGYGAQRLVDRLDWDAFRSAPTLLVGFSDFTALLHAAWVRARVTSVHGQFAGRLDRLSAPGRERLHALLRGAVPEPVAIAPEQVLVPGIAHGPLVGGNLSLISTSIGTPSQLDARGCVLFLEDVNEPPYAVDRMLTQLCRSGLLDGTRAVVVGEWRGCDPPVDRPSATVDEVVAERLGGLGVPVVTGLEIGHTDRQMALAHGAPCTLDTELGTLEVAAAAV